MIEYICMVDDHGDLVPTMEEGYELIRCKDCKYWESDDDESFCSDWGAYGTGAESYCSFAKRKEE